MVPSVSALPPPSHQGTDTGGGQGRAALLWGGLTEPPSPILASIGLWPGSLRHRAGGTSGQLRVEVSHAFREHQMTLWTRPKQVRLSAQQSDSGKPWGRHTHCPWARHPGLHGEGRAALCPRDVTQWVWTLFKLTPRTDTAGLFPSALKASV